MQTKDERRRTDDGAGIFRPSSFVHVLLCLVLALTACRSSAIPASSTAIVLDQPPIPEECLTSDQSIVLLGGTLIDGTGAAPLADVTLVIQGRCITAIGPRDQVPLPADAQVVQLDGATVLPGFINAHVHNAYLARNLQTWAYAGVTTVRDLGAPLRFPYFSRRDQLAADLRNARVVSAGPLVTVPDGYPIVPNRFASLSVTSPEDARQQIAQLVDDGADVIKITFSSSLPTLSAEEAVAIVQTAHERGIPVTAHATNPYELERALDAGVDDIAHMSEQRVKDALLHRMVQDGVYWVPTLEAMRGNGSDNLARFIQAGGQVALGTDAGYLAGLEVDMPMDELALMQEAGMTPMQIILAATRNAAHVCRLDHELGTLEPGKLADVLVVDGDPLEDLQALTRVRLVIHDGVIIRGG
jgi:imidazolonepropionase-like amidohydrolase